MPLRAFKFKIYKRKGPQSKNNKDEGLVEKGDLSQKFKKKGPRCKIEKWRGLFAKDNLISFLKRADRPEMLKNEILSSPPPGSAAIGAGAGRRSRGEPPQEPEQRRKGTVSATSRNPTL